MTQALPHTVGTLAADLRALGLSAGDTVLVHSSLRAVGEVLLLGCGHDSNTSLHLAECRQTRPVMMGNGAAVRDPSGGSHWVTWTAPVADASDFERLGEAYEAGNPVRLGKVGNADSRLMPHRALVDFATSWLERHRPAATAER